MATRKAKVRDGKGKAKAKLRRRPSPGQAGAKPKAKAKAKAKPKAKPEPSPLDIIEERVKTFGLIALSQAEQDVYVLSDLHFQVTCGGYFYNRFEHGESDPWRGRDILTAIHALQRAGQARYAELLDGSLRILLRPTKTAAKSWGDFIQSVDPDGELRAMDDELFELNDALWDVVQRAAQSVTEPA